MIYEPATRTFRESGKVSLMSSRRFDYPYGWIKESGTPPELHCDCMRMTDRAYELGEDATVKIIGACKRRDGEAVSERGSWRVLAWKGRSGALLQDRSPIAVREAK